MPPTGSQFGVGCLPGGAEPLVALLEQLGVRRGGALAGEEQQLPVDSLAWSGALGRVGVYGTSVTVRTTRYRRQRSGTPFSS